jgi:integrase
MRRKLTPAFVKAAPLPAQDRAFYWDETLPGFGLQVTASGHRSFVCQYRAKGKNWRMAINGVLDLAAARKRAKILLGEVAGGGNPLKERRDKERAAANTVKAICEEYLEREGAKLRSGEARRSTFERLVYPKYGPWPIEDIKRSDVVRLLDKIEDERGPVMADRTLAALRRVFTWHASRSDDFRSPIVPGMARTSAEERARERTLSDDELRAVWTAAKAAVGPFGYLVRFILLTAVRRNEAARMSRGEVSGSEWLIPAERMKGKVEFLVPLSPAAAQLLAEMPRVGESIVFTNDGERPLGGFGKAKAKFDEQVTKANGAPLPNWTLHDLRRTARSLMSRAKVAPDIAERCLAHKIGGIRATYDRHQYLDEKRLAFEALSRQVELVINPPEHNVVPLRRGQLQA